MDVRRSGVRELCQEIYVQDLVGALLRVYAARLRDDRGRAHLLAYLAAEDDRRRRIERVLAATRDSAIPSVRALFAAAGRLYGRVTSILGTRVMLRIALSASARASRRACARLAAAPTSDLRYLAALRARNEATLLDNLRQHLIDTQPRRG